MTKNDEEPQLIFEAEDGEAPEWGYSYVDGTPVTDPHWDARVTAVEVLTGTIVNLKFGDGFEGPMDLKLLMKGPVFDRVFELGEFDQVRLEEGSHPITIEWPSGADLAPETLRYEAGRYKVPEQVLAGIEAAVNVTVSYARKLGRSSAANDAQRDGASKVANQLFVTYELLRGIKLGSPEFEADYTAYLKRWR